MEIIRQGRYIDKRDNKKRTLVRFNGEKMVFSDGLEVDEKTFVQNFELVKADGST